VRVCVWADPGVFYFPVSYYPSLYLPAFLLPIFLHLCLSAFLWVYMWAHSQPKEQPTQVLIILFFDWVSRGVGEPVYVCVCGLTLVFSISLPSYYPSLYLRAFLLPIFLHLCLPAFP
jgi:hypothetical protein